jgi:hypothetical protein
MSERERVDKGHDQKEEPFYAGQTRILEMVAASAPLPEVLTNLVLLMEAQAEGMLCSILVLSADGLRVHHGAAPSLSTARRSGRGTAHAGQRCI